MQPDAFPPIVEPMLPLAVSLALGLLIGLERGWSTRAVEAGGRVAGVRTYGLIGLLGGVCGLISEKPALIFAGLSFVALTALLISAHIQAVRRSNEIGITSVVASLLTFAFGAATTLDYMIEAAAAAVVTALVLGSKRQMHRWVQALDETELRAGIMLLVISVVVLPILPNRGFGPWQALNPFEIWWMVVLIAAISFIGYFAMRIAGPGKGAALTGLLAGLASSTALTLHFSRLGRSRPESRDALAVGVLLACGTMFPRMLVVTGLLNRDLLPLVAPAGAAMALVTYGGAAGLWLRLRRKAPPTTQGARLTNPLELKAAIFFGGLLAVVMLAAEGLERGFGGAGVLALAAVSGVSDVDAITLTLSTRAQDAATMTISAIGIVLAGAVNSLVKAGMAFAVGGPGVGARAAVPLAVAAAIGLVAVWLTVGGITP